MLKSPFAGFGWPYKACWWPSKACWCTSKGCKRRFLMACFGKIVRFFGDVTALPCQTHCASLAMSLRFWGEWGKLLVFCEGNCRENVLLVRGEAWQSFFASRMLVSRSGKLLAGGSFRIDAVCVTSKKGNLMPRKIQMKRFGNWKWNASKITNGLV